MFKSLNPYNGEVIAKFKAESENDIESKLINSNAAFESWSKKSVEERIRHLQVFSKNLQNKIEPYSKIITLEMGKTLKEAEREISKCIVTIDYYAEHAEDYLKTVYLNTQHQKAYYTFEPSGLILAIMPWNFPFWQALRFAIPNLILGNTVLLKHAPNALWSAKNIEDTFIEAGFDEGVFQCINIDIPLVEKVIADKRVKGVTLTGSDRAGSSVASLAGKHLKKSVLELGGSDPFIVLNDADIKKAAKAAVQSRFQNSGQTCIAAKRWIVESKVYDEFKAAVMEEIKGLKTGNPLDDETTNGPVARIDLAEKIESQVNELLDSGAVSLTKWERENCLIQPQILEVNRNTMLQFTEELFGPVGCLIKADNEKEAIQIANETDYGLGASLWSADIEKAEGLVHSINAGYLFINGLVKSEAGIPFGGVNNSGYGRELGVYGMHEFARIKSYIIAK